MTIRVRLAPCLLLAAGTIQAADWTYWRGPEQNGISREKGLVDVWSLEPRKNVLWVSPIGGRATPVVMNGRIYLNCRTSHNVNSPDKIHSQEQVVCRDAATGEVIWKDTFNVFQTDIPAPRVGWAPMACDPETKQVYVHSVGGVFRCYDEEGNTIWEHSMFEDFGKFSGYGGRTQAPIIDENRVIIGFLARNWGESKGPPPKHFFYAFDKRTGALLWTSAPGARPVDTTYTNPIIAVINGTRMLICGNGNGGVYAINARTGDPIWGFMMSKRGLNASPVVDGNLVYISHGEDNIDSVEFGRIQCIDGTGEGDVTNTHSVWRVDDIKAGYTGLIVKDGILYVVADTGKLYALDSKNGAQLWTHSLGTVGKGSPVWADGKLYVMEVNGKVHILKPSREKCESLSQVYLPALDGGGYDEIYASPAIAGGRVFLVTRDRTICLANPKNERLSDPVPSLPEEPATGEEITRIQLVPFETVAEGGDEIEYSLHAFDKNGRFIKELPPTLESQEDLPGVKVDGAKLRVPASPKRQAGHVIAKHGALVATARLRVFPQLPWKWDFEDKQVPPTWINAFSQIVPAEVGGSVVMKRYSPQLAGKKGRPSYFVWLGPADMKDYTIQADVMMTEVKRKLPSVGVTANRYNFFIKGNYGKLTIQSWSAHKRMAKETTYRSDPDVWYTLKMRVDIEDDGAHVKGKVWKRGEEEPGEWTIEALDPHPNLNGSPGLYAYSNTDSYYDNVIVTATE